MNKKSLAIIIFSFLIINCFITFFIVEKTQATGNRYYVSDKPNIYNYGTAEYPFNNIQHAIDIASNGDTIYVFGGEYNETLVIDKEVTLVGSIEGGDSIISYIPSHKYTIQITADNVNLTGFNINNTLDSITSYISGALIYVTGNSVIIQNNLITNCTNGWAIYLDSADNNLIKNNNINNMYGGIYATSSKTNDIVNNSISNCTNHILKLLSSDYNTIYNNDLIYGKYGIYE